MENYEVNIEPEVLLLAPFKKLKEKYIDKKVKDGQNKLRDSIAFIYFFSDPRSDYQIYYDKEQRKNSIKEGLGLPEDWDIDSDLQAAIDFYESFKPESAMLLEDTRFAIDKLRQSLRDIDFNQVDDKGKPIYPLNTLTSTIKIIPSLVKDLNEAERALNSEIISNSKMRGSQSYEKTIFDDGIKL